MKVWMLFSKTPPSLSACLVTQNNCSEPHERCLRIIHNDKQSSFKELLINDSFVSIPERSVQILATEMYKVSNNFSPSNMNKIFEVWNEHPYNIRQTSSFPDSSKTNTSWNWNSLRIRVKHLRYFSKNLQKHRWFTKIQKGY